MGYVKSFQIDRNVWRPVYLTDAEEAEVLKKTIELHKKIFAECLKDAANITHAEENAQATLNIAAALFDKRASHNQFARENLAFEKYKKMQEDYDAGKEN